MQSKDGRVMEGSKTRRVRNDGVLEETRVSNRFGGLEEEGEKEELVDVAIRGKKNKENENTTNLSTGGSSIERGKAMMFDWAQKERKTNNLRSPTFQKPKLKPVGPTRGMVYGPTKGEIDLSMSEKILRVGKDSVGRPGGAFAGDGVIDGNEKNPDQAGEQRSLQVQLVSTETLLFDVSEPRVGQVGEIPKDVEA